MHVGENATPDLPVFNDNLPFGLKAECGEKILQVECCSKGAFVFHKGGICDVQCIQVTKLYVAQGTTKPTRVTNKDTVLNGNPVDC